MLRLSRDPLKLIGDFHFKRTYHALYMCLSEGIFAALLVFSVLTKYIIIIPILPPRTDMNVCASKTSDTIIFVQTEFLIAVRNETVSDTAE